MVDWSTQIAHGVYINGSLIEDRSKWCDWCGKDMTTKQLLKINGRTLKVHKRCKTRTINHYKL